MAWTIGATTSSPKSASAGARKSAIAVQRRRARARRARRMRTSGSGITNAGARTIWDEPLSGLGGIRDLLGHVLRLRLAGEEPLDRVVDRLADRGRVRLVEVELDERGIAARLQ